MASDNDDGGTENLGILEGNCSIQSRGVVLDMARLKNLRKTEIGGSLGGAGWLDSEEIAEIDMYIWAGKIVGKGVVGYRK